MTDSTTFVKVDTSLTVPNLVKAGLAIGAIVGAFWVIIGDVKSSITAEAKANSLSIYNLQVDLAVTKSRLDDTQAAVKQIREDERQTFLEFRGTLDKIAQTVTSIQISVGPPRRQP